MKKLLVFLLLPLLCLSLAACETEPLPTETDILVTLPTVTDWKETPASTAAASEQAPSTVPTESEAAPEPGPAEAEVPVLLGRTTLYGKISGPAGTVYAIGYQGAACKDPVYGDVDGDGRTELVYHNASETGGSTYELVCVYDLEAGWPICKAWILLCAGQGRLQLLEEEESVLCRYTPRGGVAALLPLALENEHVILNGGEPLPDGLTIEDDHPLPYGGSLQRLTEQLSDKALLKQTGLLVWQEPGVFYEEDEIADGYSSYLYVAVSDNGVTVTNTFTWAEPRNGGWLYSGAQFPPLSPIEDSNALAELQGLTETELTNQLGACDFQKPVAETGPNLTILCWITKDGKLLTVQLLDKVVGATLIDLLPQH